MMSANLDYFVQPMVNHDNLPKKNNNKKRTKKKKTNKHRYLINISILKVLFTDRLKIF